MARVNIIHVCGCGYRSKSLEEATLHSDAKHHQMETHGTIVPDNIQKWPPRALGQDLGAPRSGAREAVFKTAYGPKKHPARDFSELRKRLQTSRATEEE